MIKFLDSLSQQSVCTALAHPKHEGLRNLLVRKLMAFQFQQTCLTPEEDRASTPVGHWKWAIDFREQPICELQLYVWHSDINRETGVPKEIGFRLGTLRLDSVGQPIPSSFEAGVGGITSGAFINHGTDEEPQWSSHT